MNRLVSLRTMSRWHKEILDPDADENFISYFWKTQTSYQHDSKKK